MKYNRLGRTELSVSAVGLGGWSFGGGTDWGPADETAALNAVSAALDAGINVIDTAPVYGESEALIGRALKGCREKALLATKCGLVKNGSWTDHDLRPQTIIRQLEESLRRLQTDYIDLYQIHYPDPQTPLADALATLARLKEQGKIRHIGLCNVRAEELAAASAVCEIASVQNEYSLLHPQKGDEILPACRQASVGFIGYGTLCGGILSGKYGREPNLRRADARNYFYKCYRGEAFLNAQAKAARVSALAGRLGTYPAAVAAAWALAAPGVSCVLTGARGAEQVAQNAAGAEITLSAQDLAYLEERPCTCIR
ncbi:aldo/keto reductase [Candidatus Avelusimicrobium alvi]|uniref:aldo/keto reductase n=1 Tax=Candidatus Avelusimicrobium alvi TaxID=3416221 RepID=UPI003D0BEC7B